MGKRRICSEFLAGKRKTVNREFNNALREQRRVEAMKALVRKASGSLKRKRKGQLRKLKLIARRAKQQNDKAFRSALQKTIQIG